MNKNILLIILILITPLTLAATMEQAFFTNTTGITGTWVMNATWGTPGNLTVYSENTSSATTRYNGYWINQTASYTNNLNVTIEFSIVDNVTPKQTDSFVGILMRARNDSATWAPSWRLTGRGCILDIGKELGNFSGITPGTAIEGTPLHFNYTNGEKIRIKGLFDGTNLQCKIWYASQAEPTSWNITDAKAACAECDSADDIAIYLEGGAAATISYIGYNTTKWNTPDVISYITPTTGRYYNTTLTGTCFVQNGTQNNHTIYYKWLNATTIITEGTNTSTSDYCYQETTNQTSTIDGSCDLKYGGSYVFAGTNLSGMNNNLTITYEKPAYASKNSYWTISSGLFGYLKTTYHYFNATAETCWNLNNTHIVFLLETCTGTCGTAINAYSKFYCYNGTNYVLLENNNASGATSVGGTNNSYKIYDGNWGTYSDVSYNSISAGYGHGTILDWAVVAAINEEAMTWKIENAQRTSITENSLRSSGQNWTFACKANNGITNTSWQNTTIYIENNGLNKILLNNIETLQSTFLDNTGNKTVQINQSNGTTQTYTGTTAQEFPVWGGQTNISIQYQGTYPFRQELTLPNTDSTNDYTLNATNIANIYLRFLLPNGTEVYPYCTNTTTFNRNNNYYYIPYNERTISCNATTGSPAFTTTANISNTTPTNQTITTPNYVSNATFTFDQNTSGEVIWPGGGMNFSNTNAITVTINTTTASTVILTFNNNYQVYEFYNNANTTYNETFHVENTTTGKQLYIFKTGTSVPVPNARITLKQIINGTSKVVTSRYADDYGSVIIYVTAGASYNYLATADDYIPGLGVISFGYDDSSKTIFLTSTGTTGGSTAVIYTNLTQGKTNTQNDYYVEVASSLYNYQVNITLDICTITGCTQTTNTYNTNTGARKEFTVQDNTTTTRITISANNITIYDTTYYFEGATTDLQIEVTGDNNTWELNPFIGITIITIISILAGLWFESKRKGWGLWTTIISISSFGFIYPVLWIITVGFGALWVYKLFRATLTGEQ